MKNLFVVVMVDCDLLDTYASATDLNHALEMANPDTGSRIHSTVVKASCAGEARILAAKKAYGRWTDQGRFGHEIGVL